MSFASLIFNGLDTVDGDERKFSWQLQDLKSERAIVCEEIC